MVAPLRRLSVLFVTLIVSLSWLAVPTLAAPPVSPHLTPLPSPSPHLPSTCGDTTQGPYDPCCAFGYVLVNGTAVADAFITITNQAGEIISDRTWTTTTHLLPHYRVNLSETLGMGPGDRVTISVQYGEYLATSSYIATAGTNREDFSFAPAQPTQLISRVPQGTPEPRPSAIAPQALSRDGSLVVFTSQASKLVPRDTNGVQDAFVRDRATGRITRVSVSSSGQEANAAANHAVLSSNGRYVAFWSGATNLLSTTDTNLYDVYVHDRYLTQTERVSLASDGTPGNGWSLLPSISADGQRVVFSSIANNLVPSDTNNTWDVFVRDRATHETTRVSVSWAGHQVSAGALVARISDNGRYVVFASTSDLVPSDTNGMMDLFVRDLDTKTTTLVSVGANGEPANGSSLWAAISADGRYIAFSSQASNLVPGDENGAEDIFLRDTVAHTTTRVSVNAFGEETDGSWGSPAISADGRMVAFLSNDATAILGDPTSHRDVLVYDQIRKFLRRVSVASSGSTADHDSLTVALSTDGRTVAFDSQASNLVLGDTNGAADVFVHDWRDTWLMLFYLAADNDLHPYLLDKHQELAATVRSDVTIGLVLDGAGPHDLVSYLIQPNNSYTLGSTFFTQHEMGGISENIGDARLLEFLLTHSLRFHPADHVYLNIAGRGHALQGLAQDMNGPYPIIPPRTFHEALTAAVEASERRIDVLHLDTHHMASLETAYDAKAYADYLVASQNLSGPIFPFAAYAQSAATRPSPRHLAAQIVEEYAEAAALQPYTISAIDLGQVVSVSDALQATLDPDAFADPLARAMFQAFRNQAQKFDTRDYYLLDERDEFVDLYDFLSPGRDHPLIQPVLTAIEQAVVAERHQSGSITVLGQSYTIDLEGSHGLSIYLPPGPHGFGYHPYLDGDLYTFTEGENGWDEVLNAFFTYSGFPAAPFTAYPGLPGTESGQQRGGGR